MVIFVKVMKVYVRVFYFQYYFLFHRITVNHIVFFVLVFGGERVSKKLKKKTRTAARIYEMVERCRGIN
jgi:hypothetical protein